LRCCFLPGIACCHIKDGSGDTLIVTPVYYVDKYLHLKGLTDKNYVFKRNDRIFQSQILKAILFYFILFYLGITTAKYFTVFDSMNEFPRKGSVWRQGPGYKINKYRKKI
jgi:hypothetical protein